MIEARPHTIELPIGYTDSKEVTHKSVTFGHLITGKELFEIESDPQSALRSQYDDLILRQSITEFGSLKRPVPLSVFLALDSIDHDDLNEGLDIFSKKNREGREYEILASDKVKLVYGFEHNGLVYDVVEFGPRIIRMDDVEADKLGYEGARRHCFLAGKQIARFSQSDGASEWLGPVGLDIFEQLLVADIQAIRVAGEVHRQSFR